MGFFTSSGEEVTFAPNKGQRVVCWEKRDRFLNVSVKIILIIHWIQKN